MFRVQRLHSHHHTSFSISECVAEDEPLNHDEPSKAVRVGLQFIQDIVSIHKWLFSLRAVGASRRPQSLRLPRLPSLPRSFGKCYWG